MGYKRITPMDVYEIYRRWHNGQSKRSISRTLGLDRKTISKLIRKVEAKGITLDAPLPPKEQFLTLIQDSFPARKGSAKAQQILQPYLTEVVNLVDDKNNPLKPKSAFEVICQRHNLIDKVSYSSFKRFVQTNNICIATKSNITCRIEVPPGREIQVDYARMGLLFDSLEQRKRVVYAFIGTLSYSRHKYVEFVYSQNQQSFIASHINMIEFFGGVPEIINSDNLKAAVIKPSLYDPKLNRTFQELAEHYNFFIDPSRVAHPKDKGKVERDVQTVQEQYRKLLALFPSLCIQKANRCIRQWAIEDYGQKEHGTTGLKPYPTFLDIEKPKLKTLPKEPFEMTQWKEATVHPDQYIQFDKKYYSIPFQYCKAKDEVWVRATHKLVQIYFKDRLIKQHVIKSNKRHTDMNDFPKNVQAALDEGVPLQLQIKAGKIGPKFKKLIRNILEPHAFMNLRKAQGLISLSERHSHSLVEKAATIALDQNIFVIPKTFKRLLGKLEQQTQEQELSISSQTKDFIRDIDYFFNKQ